MSAAPLRVLVLGSGAREHAIARALLRGHPDREVIVAPGNAGTRGPRLRSAPVSLADQGAVVALARAERADLVVVGPEAPLVEGVVDALAAAGFDAFGPTAAAARLEASKAFLKELARDAGIPTAAFTICRTMSEAERAIDERAGRCVVKADGLCAGKGVVVAASRDEALAAARAMLEERVFGAAGEVVVVEDLLPGREVSLHAVSDGTRYALLPPARDHKRIFDGDRGPNTGGMGVVCPTPDVDAALLARIDREIVAPTLRAMAERGCPFRGALFAGLMIAPDGTPWLLEHNVRFGDPETEALFALVEGDAGVWLVSAARGALDPASVRVTADRAAVVVILAAADYPAEPRRGDVITGIERAESLADVAVHHAGTALRDGQLVTNGGRVLAVTATGPDLASARVRAYEGVAQVHFDGAQHRTDIGASTLALG